MKFCFNLQQKSKRPTQSFLQPITGTSQLANRICSGGGIYTLQQVKRDSDNENSFVNKIYK
jgi:hypothetical protein